MVVVSSGRCSAATGFVQSAKEQLKSFLFNQTKPVLTSFSVATVTAKTARLVGILADNPELQAPLEYGE